MQEEARLISSYVEGSNGRVSRAPKAQHSAKAETEEGGFPLPRKRSTSPEFVYAEFVSLGLEHVSGKCVGTFVFANPLDRK